MADTTISGMPAATTPLAGTELLPAVQSGGLVKVTANNITNRSIAPTAITGTPTMTGTNVTGVPLTTGITGTLAAGHGGTGSATVPTAGQILVGNAGGTAFAPVSFSGDISVDSAGLVSVTATTGAWVPVDASGIGLSISDAAGTYATVGKLVFITGEFTYPVTVDTSAATIGGLPFLADGSTNYGLTTSKSVAGASTPASPYIVAGADVIEFSIAGNINTTATNAGVSTNQFRISGWYLAA